MAKKVILGTDIARDAFKTKVNDNFTELYDKDVALGAQINNLDALKVTPHLADLITDSNGAHGLVYENGVWTPVIQGSVIAGTGTYSTRVAKYTKINKLVFFSAVIVYSAHTGTGNLQVAGLPFIPNSNYPVNIGAFTGIPIPSNGIAATSTASGIGVINFSSYPAGGGNVTNIAIDSDGGRIDVSGYYQIN